MRAREVALRIVAGAAARWKRIVKPPVPAWKPATPPPNGARSTKLGFFSAEPAQTRMESTKLSGRSIRSVPRLYGVEKVGNASPPELSASSIVNVEKVRMNVVSFGIAKKTESMITLVSGRLHAGTRR